MICPVRQQHVSMGHTWGDVQYRISVQNSSQPKSREISFTHNLILSYQIILKFCTEHGSDTAVFCAKFQKDWIIEANVMEERDFAGFH